MDTGERAYEKIINYVEQQVMQGRYKKGDKLPPERELAALLGASRNSVREGLGILERMGAISSQQGAGNFISDNFEKTLVEVMTLMFILEEGTFREISEFRYALETQHRHWLWNISPKSNWRTLSIICPCLRKHRKKI